ncbi:MAG: DEAD/DEAH box helicase family protein [Methanobrevibacter sp.]|nr:DEAD/DEAH box helicase family protein [Methanobrevibacter sp.]
MGLKDLETKFKYDSDRDDIINDFYIPVLKESCRYYRLSGFFSSSVLTVVARGMENFIKNNGKMYLICSVELPEKDIKVIEENIKNPSKALENQLIETFDDIEEGFVKDHVSALAWMLAKGNLKIKIAMVADKGEGMFHQKVGIMEDSEGNAISFSGSNNETAAGLMYNIEDFKVFRNWEKEQKYYFDDDYASFFKYWNNLSNRMEVIDLPEAIIDKIIEKAPNDINDLDLKKYYHENIRDYGKKSKEKINLRSYQKKAIDNWLKEKKGIFAMATGTGKTYTALGCLQKVLKKEKKIISVIASPYQHLVQQWKNSIEYIELDKIFDRIIIIDGGHPMGKKILSHSLLDMYNGDEDLNKILVLTTHDSFSGGKFIELLRKSELKCPHFLIVDEMHGAGSYTHQNGLLELYDYRLGLSATPKRCYDDFGTDLLFNYFKGVVCDFSLEKALKTNNPETNKTYLTPYKYHPYFTNLNYEELEKYQDLTKKIIIESNKDDNGTKNLENLMFARANVIKNAKSKYSVLKNILDDMGEGIKDLLIYCSDKQIDKVIKILEPYNLHVRKFTMELSATPQKKHGNKSERDIVIEDFSNGFYSVLVAMKCLDEGVDIPSASKAILMCNSSNPREFIQRIGRIIRRNENKTFADAYDIIIKPSSNSIPEFKDIENDIYEKELIRSKNIIKLAVNRSEIIPKIYSND